MNSTVLMIIIGVAAFLLGGFICYLIFKNLSNGILRKAEEEAEVIKKNKIIEAKEKFIALKAEHENRVQQSTQKAHERDARLQQREQQLSQRQGELQRTQNELAQRKQQLDQLQQSLDFKQKETDKIHRQAQLQLENISGLSAEDAKKQLIESIRDEAESNAMAYVNECMDDARMTANKEAKKIIVQTIQRIATEAAIENSVSVFHIENDEMKGRIIGREGRNIPNL